MSVKNQKQNTETNIQKKYIITWTEGRKKQKENRRHLDSSAPAFADGIGHSRTRRVDHGHEANEAEVLSGEVHLVGVKSKAIWELVIGQVVMTET